MEKLIGIEILKVRNIENVDIWHLRYLVTKFL